MPSFFFAALVAAAAVGAAACGANVVFIDENGQGAGAGASPSTGGGGAGSACDMPVEGELHDLCFQSLSPPCLPSNSSIVAQKASAAVAVWTCSDACCTYFVKGVPCGPTVSPEGDECCYGVDVVVDMECPG